MTRPALILALTLVAAAAPAQEAPPAAIAPGGTMLEISATGRSARVPDVATIRAGVVAEAPTAAAALADQANRMRAVLAALGRAGIAPRDIATAAVGLAPQYRYTDGQPPRITGYQATNTVAIRFRDVARAGPALDALVAAGANQIEGPDLAIDRPEAATDEARLDAMATARARAELYARAAGLHVVRIVAIEEGGAEPGVVRPLALARAKNALAPTAIAAGETDVTVTITVRVLLG